MQQRIEFLLHDLVNERAFPGPRGSGDADELFERDVDVDVLEIVLASARDGQRRLLMLNRQMHSFSQCNRNPRAVFFLMFVPQTRQLL